MNRSALTLPHQPGLHILLEVEESLENDVNDPFLTWDEKLELNQALKNIRERILVIDIQPS